MINLIQGDCLEKMKEIPDKSIDLVVTDPPYLHDKGGNGGGNTKIAISNTYNKNNKIMREMSSFSEESCITLLNECDRLLKKFNGYFFCNDSLIPYYLNWAIKNKYKYTILCWNKPLSILNRERYSTNIEYIIRIYSEGCALNKLDLCNQEIKNYYSKYQYINQIKGKNKLHPTQKLIEILKGYILLSSNEGDIILDPFMGSCSTGEASLSLNRNFIGIEIDEKYYKIAQDRIKNFLENKKREFF